jgi:hypothetical protein
MKKRNKPYNPEFVKEILEAAKLERERIRMTMEELKDLCK